MIGHIYRIIHLESDIQYVGSTFNEPRKRWQQHKNDYSKWIAGNHDNVAIYPYFKEYGINKFKLIVIKSYDVVDRKHLVAYEQLWISKFQCVNTNNAFQLSRLAQRKYYQDHRDALRAYNKIYEQNRRTRPDNFKDTIHCLCGGRYQQCSKAFHFQTDRHQSWVANGEPTPIIRSDKHQCECGGQYVSKHKGSHTKSKKHQLWLSQNS